MYPFLQHVQRKLSPFLFLLTVVYLVSQPLPLYPVYYTTHARQPSLARRMDAQTSLQIYGAQLSRLRDLSMRVFYKRISRRRHAR